jgi:hypothetical protein
MTTTSIAPTPLAASGIAAAESAATPVKAWMSWEGGVDIAGVTKPGLTAPNLILHVARIVHTSVGSAASGIVFWQPDPTAPPLVVGFVSESPTVGAYFGPQVFAGTPFEKVPVLPAKITVESTADGASSRIEAGGHVFTVKLAQLAPAQVVDRPAGGMPFRQQGVESAAGSVIVTIDGKPVEVIVPPPAPGGGANAVFSQTGVYSR